MKDRISALGVSMMLRHAFMTGAGVKELERIPDDVQRRWLTYGENETIPYLEEMTQAAKEYNEARRPDKVERSDE